MTQLPHFAAAAGVPISPTELQAASSDQHRHHAACAAANLRARRYRYVATT